MIRAHKMVAEERCPISGQGYTVVKLLDGTECQILLDTGASKTYAVNRSITQITSLPKFSSKTKRNQVGNGQYVSILFVIPIIIVIHGHRFEIYTLESEIHENVDIVSGIKNVFELEGVIN